MNPLRLLILSDGRPGHFNLAEGIAAAVARLRPVEIERRDARRGRWPGLAAAGLANAGLPPAVMLRAVYGLDAATLSPADLVVSAGAETLAANVWIARINSAPNIFYGSLRAFRPTDFALVLTSYERNADRPNHALFLKPSQLDPDTLPASTHRAPIARDAPPPLIGLLVGGDAGTIRYAADDWTALLDFVVDLHRQCGTRWFVANSRRTPDAISDRLAALASGGDSAIERFVDVRSAGPGTLGPILAAADAMIATDNSSSMISECAWARLPVLGVSAAGAALPEDETLYRAWMMREGWTATLPIAQLAHDRVLDTLARLRPLGHNPQADLAALIRSRIPTLFAESGA